MRLAMLAIYAVFLRGLSMKGHMQKLSCLHERCVELTFRSNLLLLDGEARNLAWVKGDILERGETKRWWRNTAPIGFTIIYTVYILFNTTRVGQRVSWPKPSSGTAHLVSAGIHVVPNESH